MATRVLKEFVIDKIAAVDRPCQEHAQVTIMKRKFDTKERKDMADKGEAMDDGSFPIKSAKDVVNSVHDWGRAGSRTDVKQHIIQRAKQIGASDMIPDEWVKKMAPEELGKVADLLSKQIYMSTAPYAQLDDDDADDEVAEDFDTALSEVLAYQMDWKVESAVQDLLSPLMDALRKSITSICKDQSLDPNMRLLEIRNSVGQFLTALQSKYNELQIPQQISTVVTKREQVTKAEIAILKLKLSVMQAGVAKANRMLTDGFNSGTMPKTKKPSRNSQPMDKAVDLSGLTGSKKKPKSHKGKEFG